MSIEETKVTAEVRSVRELNMYLLAGWVLLLTYVKNSSDAHEPRFVIGWQSKDEPKDPEHWDEWELQELDKLTHR